MSCQRPRLPKFKVIYADPAWSYRDRCDAGRRGAAHKYKVMSDGELQALPVRKLAADNSVLFLWATWPKLEDAFAVMRAWGFTYSTIAFVWVKTAKQSRIPGTALPLHWGMGWWTRSNTEPCLLGLRGKPVRRSRRVHSVVHAPRGKLHSAKPLEVRERIEQLTYGPRIELFLRGATPRGWYGWGNQASGRTLRRRGRGWDRRDGQQETRATTGNRDSDAASARASTRAA